MHSAHEFQVSPVGLRLRIARNATSGTVTGNIAIIKTAPSQNTRLSRRSDFSDLINRSINQTLSRTVITSGTTLIAVIAFLVLGGEVISDVAFTLVVGIVVGTYSSVYVASSLLLAWPGKSAPGKPAPGNKKAASGGKKSAAKA